VLLCGFSAFSSVRDKVETENGRMETSVEANAYKEEISARTVAKSLWPKI
jgi:hypothetical protein